MENPRRWKILLLGLLIIFSNGSCMFLMVENDLKNITSRTIIFDGFTEGNASFSLMLPSLNPSYVKISADATSPRIIKMHIVSPALNLDISLMLEKIVNAEALSGEISYYYTNGKFSFTNGLDTFAQYNITLETSENHPIHVFIVHDFTDFSILVISIVLISFIASFMALLSIVFSFKRQMHGISQFKFLNVLILIVSIVWCVYSFSSFAIMYFVFI